MKKYIAKIAVFLTCFAIGTGFVWKLSFFAQHADFSREKDFKPVLITDSVVKNRQGNGLEVKFVEIVDTGGGFAADFEITNFEEKSFYYNSYEMTVPGEPLFMLYSVKINGKEENLGWCGTGLKTFELKSGESKIFRVSGLSHRWKPGKGIQFGFNFSQKRDQDYQTFWSEKLPIDKATAEQLLREKERN